MNLEPRNTSNEAKLHKVPCSFFSFLYLIYYIELQEVFADYKIACAFFPLWVGWGKGLIGWVLNNIYYSHCDCLNN